jgi:flagellar L-ring protein precursor FlgH
MKIISCLLLAAIMSAPCHADSLFPVSTAPTPGSGAGVSLYADNIAHQVGDILTVLIDENAAANSQATTQSSKTENAAVTPGTGPNIVHIGSFQLGLGSIPALGLGDSAGSKASGATTRSDTLTGEITVIVQQVLPNGNLLVSGTRSVGMNSETESISLTGTVRPQDVSSSNTIESSQIADAEIKYGGKGTVSEKQHDGLITRITRFLF